MDVGFERIDRDTRELRAELHSELGTMRGELRSETGSLRAEIGALRTTMNRVGTGMIVSLVGVIAAVFANGA
jgi:hypothetical protein